MLKVICVKTNLKKEPVNLLSFFHLNRLLICNTPQQSIKFELKAVISVENA